MKSLILIFPAIFFLAFNIQGQDSSALKRKPYRLIIPFNKENDYIEELNETPYVFPDNAVQIYPGETVYIEVTQENGNIVSFKAVPENKNPDKTLILSFTQTLTKKVHQSMTLKVKNPFKQQLTYKAQIYLFKQQKWVDTDVYPVEPGLFGIEIWPDFIISIALRDWSFKKD
jgi:hypothetical protein